MHTMGTRLSTEVLRKDGGKETLVNAPFDFNAQVAYDAKMVVKAGDTVRTSCSWKNSTDQPVKFGESTGEEMCFDFVYYYPRINDVKVFGLPLFTWITPSSPLLASCKDG